MSYFILSIEGFIKIIHKITLAILIGYGTINL